MYLIVHGRYPFPEGMIREDEDKISRRITQDSNTVSLPHRVYWLSDDQVVKLKRKKE